MSFDFLADTLPPPAHSGWWDWGQEEKGTTEDEMAGQHHGLDERESE